MWSTRLWWWYFIMWWWYFVMWWWYFIMWCWYFVMWCWYFIMWCWYFIMWCWYFIMWCWYFVMLWWCSIQYEAFQCERWFGANRAEIVMCNPHKPTLDPPICKVTTFFFTETTQTHLYSYLQIIERNPGNRLSGLGALNLFGEVLAVYRSICVVSSSVSNTVNFLSSFFFSFHLNNTWT